MTISQFAIQSPVLGFQVKCIFHISHVNTVEGISQSQLRVFSLTIEVGHI